MGLFSKIFSAFSGATSQAAANTSFLQTYSGGSGGWGLDRFNSIISAHSSAEEIVDEFGLDQEGCGYMSVDGEEDSYKGYKWKRVTINPSNSVDEPAKVNTELNECETTIESTSKDGSE